MQAARMSLSKAGRCLVNGIRLGLGFIIILSFCDYIIFIFVLCQVIYFRFTQLFINRSARTESNAIALPKDGMAAQQALFARGKRGSD